ncbi:MULTISPECIES: BON domain-containing protein [Rhizobium]|uniref:BON domain-containing protein n=1 Tax=Rhizobium TaxID=379 RepID=UPI00046284CD|nr:MULTISPECIES: BON domain-containing protein [Rhizobium]UFS79413.1 BON domain-containing protein [Rhizobium sp. T136]
MMFMPQFNGSALTGERAPFASLADEIWSAIAYCGVAEDVELSVVESAGAFFLEGQAPSQAVADQILQVARRCVGSNVFSRMSVR